MDFDGEGFKEFSKTKGKIRFEAAGHVEEKDYSSANFVNSAGTIGYSVVEVDGKPDHIIVSRTAVGIVLTMPGDQTGPARRAIARKDGTPVKTVTELRR